MNRRSVALFLGFGFMKVLSISVDGDEINPLHVGGDHVIYSVVAGAADSDHSDSCERLYFGFNEFCHVFAL